MAIVADLSGNFPNSTPTGVDGSFASVNRVVAAPPNGVTTPLYSGEVVRDTAGQALWIALGLANTAWVPCSVES